jgi:hypothetical protein
VTWCAIERRGGAVMGKYFVGWLLGIPLGVLVLLYFFFG